MHRTIYNTLRPSTGWHLIPFPSPQRVYGRKLHHNKIFSDGYFIVYQIFLPMELRCARFFTKSTFDSSLKLCVHLMKLALKIPWNWRKIMPWNWRKMRHFESLTDAFGYICPALNARRPRIRDTIRWEKRTHKPRPPDGEAVIKGLPAFFARANQTGQTPTSAPTKFLIS